MDNFDNTAVYSPEEMNTKSLASIADSLRSINSSLLVLATPAQQMINAQEANTVVSPQTHAPLSAEDRIDLQRALSTPPTSKALPPEELEQPTPTTPTIAKNSSVKPYLVALVKRLVEEWRSRPKQAYNTLTFHTSVTRPSFKAGYAAPAVIEIRKWHTKGNGWSDIGYACLIGRHEADYSYGRPMNRTGAHVRGHNKNNLGVCLLGGLVENSAGTKSRANDPFEMYYTEEQRQTVLAFIIAFRIVFEKNMPWGRRSNYLFARGHNDFTNMKTCPNFKVEDFIEDNREELDALFLNCLDL